MSDWSDLMKNTCTIENVTSVDGAGNKTYGASATYICRVAGSLQAERSVEGVERVTRPRVYFNQEVTVGIDSRITLTGFVPTQPAIRAVSHYPDETGKRYTVIDL